MAYQGQARESRIFSGSKAGASHAESLARSQLNDTEYYYRKQQAENEKDKSKQAYTWFKDLYNFASSNKDNLDDPDVQDIIDHKMQKIESTGFFTRAPRHDPGMTRTMDAGGGLEGAVHQRGAPEPERERILRDINQLHQRFMLEHPAQYAPYETPTVTEGGDAVRRRTDPISGQVTDYSQQPTVLGEGQRAMVFKGGRMKDVGGVGKTYKPDIEYGEPKFDKALGIGQYDETGKFHVIVSRKDLSDIAKADTKYKNIPDSVFNKALGEALKDAADQEKGFFGKVLTWFTGESAEDWLERVTPYLDAYLGKYLETQGKTPPTKESVTPTTPKLTPQQQKADSILFGKGT